MTVGAMGTLHALEVGDTVLAAKPLVDDAAAVVPVLHARAGAVTVANDPEDGSKCAGCLTVSVSAGDVDPASRDVELGVACKGGVVVTVMSTAGEPAELVAEGRSVGSALAEGDAGLEAVVAKTGDEQDEPSAAGPFMVAGAQEVETGMADACEGQGAAAAMAPKAVVGRVVEVVEVAAVVREFWVVPEVGTWVVVAAQVGASAPAGQNLVEGAGLSPAGHQRWPCTYGVHPARWPLRASRVASAAARATAMM